MATSNTETTAADSDDDYLSDVVVRAAMERLQRKLSDEPEVESVHSERFAEIGSRKTDYIKVNLKEHTMGNGHTVGYLIQKIAETGVVRFDRVDTDRECIRVAPSED